MSTTRAVFAAIALSVLGSHLVFSQADPKMSFFVTSVGLGNGANLGGLDGADKHCLMLATAVGAGNHKWRAYLSSQGPTAVNARDRIAKGSVANYNWYNAKGVLVARTRAELHGQTSKVSKDSALNEKGEPVNLHDILTGSQPDGTYFPPAEDRTCQNWTSNTTGSAQVGHTDGGGQGDAGASWNSAHPTKGCGQKDLGVTSGGGLFYCFVNSDN